MARSPDNLIPSGSGQLERRSRDDKAFKCRKGGEVNLRAAITVNAVEASLTPPASKPTQLELFPGRVCPAKAKPATVRTIASKGPDRRDGVRGGGTRRKCYRITGETLFGPAEGDDSQLPYGRKAYKGEPRNRGYKAEQGVGGGHSTEEPRENRGEGRAAAFTKRPQQGKTAGLPPRGKAQSRPKTAKSKAPKRMDQVRKLQRALYRAAKRQPERRFTKLYDKVCRGDVLRDAWRLVKANKGGVGVDAVGVEEVEVYGEERFLQEVEEALETGTYRASKIRRVYIPKPGQPGKKRPLGIPVMKDRVVQMAVKIVVEPLFEADFLACSYGFRPKRTPRMALEAIVASYNEGCGQVVDVDLKAYFDTINHDRLLKLVERRVADLGVLRLMRAWLKAGVVEEGKVTHPTRGTPQGGVISPLLSNIYLHEVDRRFCRVDGRPTGPERLVRYADDMVLLTETRGEAEKAWERFQQQIGALDLELNQEKSKLTTVREGFTFLGFEFRSRKGLLYLWPRAKAVKHIGERVREVVRAHLPNAPLKLVIQKLNQVLIGWCTYFRVGNSNRVFHKVDWMARGEVQGWLRKKHRCRRVKAAKRWNYNYLHQRCRLYRMVGKVSHLEGLRCTPPEEGDRRAVCGKIARTVR